MKMEVKSDVGRAVNTTVEADKHDTVHDLRDRVSADQDVRPDNISLAHNGEILSPGDTLKQAGLKDGDVLRALPADAEGGSSPRRSSFSPDIDRQRLQEESTRVRRAGLPLTLVTPQYYQGTLVGKGVWQNQTYPLHIKLPDGYPHVPPRVRLGEGPKPLHPNISPDGLICVALLDERNWQDDYNVPLVYRTLQHLFEDPNWDDPLNVRTYKALVLHHLWKFKEGINRSRR